MKEHVSSPKLRHSYRVENLIQGKPVHTIYEDLKFSEELRFLKIESLQPN